MPPRKKVSREELVSAGLEIVRQEGVQALNARELAARLGVSTQPIFSHYAGMAALRADVIAAAHARYQEHLKASMENGRYSHPYKGSGLGYIRFAKEEPELFKLLFMRDRTGEEITEQWEEIAPLVRLIQEKTGFSQVIARRFHLEMWIYVHGFAVMVATNYLPWREEDMEEMLSDAFFGLLSRYQEKELNQNERH